MSRLLSDDDLRILARSPRDELLSCLSRSDPTAAGTVCSSLEAGCNSQIDRYESWTANLETFLAQRSDDEARVELIAVTRAFCVKYPALNAVPAERPASVAPNVQDAARRHDAYGALQVFDQMTASWLELIDFHRDWISYLLSHIYRRSGPDELGEALRYCGERSVLLAMAKEIQRPPVERLRGFVALLHGHFSEIVIEEDDKKFTITQDPCGTCSRQVTDGRYAPPLDLAVVTNEHDVTWQRGDTPIYRCHIPIWHIELARREIGAPFPVNQCPAGISDAPCRILLYKNPLDPDASARLPHGT